MTRKIECFNNIEGRGWYYSTKITLPDGTYKRISGQWFKTKGEAKADFDIKKADAIEQANNVICIKGYDDFIDEFEDYRRHKVCPSTVKIGDSSMISCYFDPFFKGKKLDDAFSRSNVASWYRSLEANNKISANRKNKLISLFKIMMEFAYNSLYIDPKTYQLATVRCYTFKDERPMDKRKERVAWTKGEQKAFLGACGDGTIDNLMFKLFLATAPRLGEFLALMPKCYSHERSSIKVFQQVDYENKGNWNLTDRLKTHTSYREIFFSSDINDLLQQYITDFNIGDDEFIFSGKKDHKSPLSRHAFRDKMTRYAKLAGIRIATPHAVRHMRSTEMSHECETMADLEAVASMLGHSPSVDLNTYASHNTEDRARELIKKADAKA